MNITSSVKETPEFAALCSYLQLFGNDLNISLSHCQLETCLENKDIAKTPKQWIDLHRKLLARMKIKFPNDKWESALNKFINASVASEALTPDFYDKEYFSISAQHRARLLNIIFDNQFDINPKFKEKINLKQIKDLRVQPFGSDVYGCLYWLFVDSEINIIMYKENVEEESFKIVAQSIESMYTLLDELRTIADANVELSKLYIESVTPEDTNSPINELDIIKEEPLESTVKTEESQQTATIAMNGNDSSIKYEKHIENDTDLPLPIEVKQEVKTDDHSENGDTLIIATNETEENASEKKSKDDELECLNTNDKSPEVKIIEKKKRGRKPKCDENVSVETAAIDLSTNLRRSERKRKPVNPFTILYSPPSTKKNKINDSQNDNTDVAESECNQKVKVKDKNKDKIKSKNKDHSKRGRPKKLKKHSNKDKESKSKKKLRKEMKHKAKSHRKHKRSKPWEGVESSEEHVEEEDEEYLYHREESETSHTMNENDHDKWNDKPESDFDADNMSVSSDEETRKSRGRNYFRQKHRQTKAEQEELINDTPCQICLGVNLPEMILLCDDCDLGHHAMCLKPSLMIIPEGDWFCPKCQHKKFVNNLTAKITELEGLLAKNVAKIRMQERLNFVNISMSNILSDKRSSKHCQKSSSDERRSNSMNGSSSPSCTSSSGSDNSSDDSSSSASEKGNHGRYKFRESSRKENTRYDFEEIDKIFDNALENDEKYQMMKKRHDGEEGEEESEPEYDYSGIEPRKKSSGKDMSNILEDEKPRLRRPTKRKRLTYATDDDDFEDDEKDQDFKLSDQSYSDLDEDDEDEAKLSEKDCSEDSDELWISRARRSTRKSHKRKDKKKRRVEFQDVTSRPRRSAARKVNYLEMLGDLDDEDDNDVDDNEGSAQHSPDFDSSDNNDSSKPPPVLARKKGKLLSKRRRKISDSEYEESVQNDSASDNNSGSTDELQNVNKSRRKLCVDSDTDSERDDGNGKLVIEERKCSEQVQGNRNEVEEDVESKKEGEEVVEEKKKEDMERKNEEEEDVVEGTKKEGMENVERNFKKREENVECRKIDVIGKKTEGEEEMGNDACLSVMNPMRAKDDEDIDVENEVESETDSD